MTPCPVDAPAGRAARCWTLVSGDGAVDLEIAAADSDSIADLLPALRRTLGCPVEGLWAGSRRLPDELLLDAPQLRHGAVLGLGRPGPRDPMVDRPSALELRVAGGPGAGSVVPLSRGRHVVGRGAGATVRLDDPDVSRRHAEIHVGGGAVTVVDLGSTNGTRLDGRPVGDAPQPWPTGAALRLGASTLTLAGPTGRSARTEGSTGGRVRLRAPERLVPPAVQVEVAFPRPPDPPAHRRLAWVAVALPAVGGVAMAWLLHTPTFLFFALLSPVVALGTWLSDRVTGRRTGRRAAAQHAADVRAAEQRLAHAVQDDVRALTVAHPDLATLAGAARRRSRPLWERSRSDGDALVVRIGSGPGPTRVTRVGGDGSRAPAPAPDVPVVVDLRTGGLGVAGPRDRTRHVLAGVLAQLSALHAPGEVDLLLLAEAGRLSDWEWARWLPHLDPRAVLVRTESPSAEHDDVLHRRLTAVLDGRRAALAGRAGPPGAGPAPPWLVAVVDGAVAPRVAAALRAGRDAGVVVLTHGSSTEDLPVPVPAVLRLGGETGDRAVLSRTGADERSAVTVDRLAPAVAGAFARDLAALEPPRARSALPRQVRLLDLPSDGLGLDPEGRLSGRWSRSRRSLVATLGRGAEGPLTLDLCRAGPHALVAGTTGSGKSELLQTLIAGLALHHPPDRCSFLLIDYKGGAAFADAVDLPHTVGLLTDLDAQSTSRALRSLSAELVRREKLLAAHGAVDIADLLDDVPLARLVIVVDEFATLAEDLPSFVPELIGIAQRGRSLGVHLVLATQRPSGVVSPEIRANCSLRICLRTADEADARDVLGAPDAAHLPLDVPGRAYVRLGSAAPVALQIARVSGSADPGNGGPQVGRWSWPAAGPRPDRAEPNGPSDLARACRAIADRGTAEGIPPPHRPWLAPLPPRLAADELPGSADPDRVAIGLVDQPDRQRQEVLEIDLRAGGSWLAVGGPRSGRTTLLRSVLAGAVRAFGPAQLHVHVIDAGGGALADEAAGLPHTGTAIGRDDALRTVRLVDRLGQEIGDRRAGTATGRPPILLLVDGVDEVLALLDDADPGAGSGALLRLVREGAAVGVTTVLTADRAIPGSRLAGVAGRRLVLPLPDRADYVIAGVAAGAVPAFRPPGRALLGEEALECQLALPAGPPPEPVPRPATGAALRIPELPADPVLPLPPAGHRPGDALPLPLGPGGDEGAVLTVDLLRTDGLLVAGPPGSGRSALLDALAAHLIAGGTPVLRIAPRPGLDPTAPCLRPDDTGALRRWLASLDGRPGVVLADDVGAPADATALAELPAGTGEQRVLLVAASTAGQLSAHYQGPVAALRRSRTGLLLCPQPGDADLLGVRLPRTRVPVRPGSGWWVDAGTAQRVQVARRRTPGGPDAPA